MGWQVQNATVLIAGNTVINPNGIFTYSGPPAAGNLIASSAPAAGTDSFGNNYLQGNSAYGATFATSMNGGFLTLYTGSLAGGWTSQATIQTSGFGDLILTAAAGRAVSTANNTLDNGSGNMIVAGTLSVNGSTSTGAGDNGGVTSGPSGTVNAFPAAGPNHTHAEVHHHPL
jgi:hypothetical protein